MRFFLAVLVMAFAAASLCAQSDLRRAVVKTLDGGEARGVLIDLDAERVLLHVDGEPVEVPMSEVVDFQEVDAEWRPLDPDAPAASRDDEQGAPAQAVRSRGTSGGGAAAPLRWSALGYLPSRLGWVADRYPWMAPQNALQAVSLAMLALVVLGLCIHLGTAAAGIEDRGIVRALGLGGLVLVASTIQLACIEFNGATLGAMAAGNVLLWWLGGRALFGARLMQMVTVVCVAGFLLALGFLALEAVDFVMLTDPDPAA